MSEARSRPNQYARPGTRPYRPAPEGQCPGTACEALCTAASCICPRCRCAACARRLSRARTRLAPVERGGQFAFFRDEISSRFNPISQRLEGTVRR